MQLSKLREETNNITLKIYAEIRQSERSGKMQSHFRPENVFLYDKNLQLYRKISQITANCLSI